MFSHKINKRFISKTRNKIKTNGQFGNDCSHFPVLVIKMKRNQETIIYIIVNINIKENIEKKT